MTSGKSSKAVAADRGGEESCHKFTRAVWAGVLLTVVGRSPRSLGSDPTRLRRGMNIRRGFSQDRDAEHNVMLGIPSWRTAFWMADSSISRVTGLARWTAKPASALSRTSSFVA